MTTTPAGLPGPDYLVLASASPRRREFLAALGLPFSVLAPGQTEGVPEVDESPLPGEAPAAMVQRLSQAKAQAVANKLPELLPGAARLAGLVVIAADTVVVLDEAILGKPATPAAAVDMLTRLRNRPHFVYSGLTALRPNANAGITRLHQSRVWMRAYSNQEIAAYVDSGDPLDKAGAYGIQNQEFMPVAKLEGCFASVMGFPLGELAAALHQLKLALPAVAPLCRRLTQTDCCQRD